MPLRHWALPQTHDTWVLALSLLVILPHLFYLPVAIAILCLGCWSLNLVLVSRRTRLSKAAKVSLVLVVVATLLLTLPKLALSHSLYGLVVLLVTLKPLEAFDRRGHRSFVILCLICAMMFFFRDGGVNWLIYYLGCFLALMGFLFTADLPDLAVKRALQKSGWMMIQALPVAMLVFIGIPRTESPILRWESERAGAITLSGVPERVRLDMLGSMAESDEIAFEASFDGPVPDSFDLYWRGTVLSFTDGRVWTSHLHHHYPISPDRLLQGESQNSPIATQIGKPVSYQVRLRNPSDDWLVALDLPVTQIESSTLTEDFQLVPLRKFGPNFEYRLTSALSIRTPREEDWVLKKALQLPSDPRFGREARSMGEELRSEYGRKQGSDQKVIQHLLRFFSEESYFYTLDAPMYRTNPTDQFLFEGRWGFCTHYAAAMTFLLRSADIPARMIAGYHGGDWSRSRDKLIVRQRHAHAWVEAWVEGHGWLRLDPTAVIPQERVLTDGLSIDGMSALNQNEDIFFRGETAGDWRQFLNESRSQGNASGDDLGLEGAKSGSWLALVIDQLGYLWDNWVKGFDHSQQQSLFGKASSYFVFAGLLVGLVSLYVAFAGFRSRNGVNGGMSSQVGALYERLCRRL
ncbi:MAG: DUF3488 and transglutaminase-like domain-containing protein, partial [Verrucomicrobiota bacterium]